jgi:hypothetical protein
VCINQNNYKIITTRASFGANSCFGNTFIGLPNEVHTKSYISFNLNSENEAKSLLSYMKCKLPNFMLSLRKITQDISATTCKWIPVVPLTIEWTDNEVYEYFNLSREDIKLINIAKNNGKNISYDVYGMQSGHAQLSLYSTIFIYLVFNNIYLTLIYLIISLFTLNHRVKFKKHTVLQVFIGSFIGIIVSYFIYEMTKKNISGKWIKKKDDYALN